MAWMGRIRPRLLPCLLAALLTVLATRIVGLAEQVFSGRQASVVRTAYAAPPPAHAAAPAPAPPPPPALASPAPAAVIPPGQSDAELALLQDLRSRRAAIDEREKAAQAREAVLGAAEHRLAARVDELTALQARLEKLEGARHDHDEANWRGLVKTYEAMRPRDAAVIWNDLDMQVLLPVLDRMKETKAAPVLAAMQPERARQVTAQLAQMRTRTNQPPD